MLGAAQVGLISDYVTKVDPTLFFPKPLQACTHPTSPACAWHASLLSMVILCVLSVTDTLVFLSYSRMRPKAVLCEGICRGQQAR